MPESDLPIGFMCLQDSVRTSYRLDISYFEDIVFGIGLYGKQYFVKRSRNNIAKLPTCMKVVCWNNHGKSAIFPVMFLPLCQRKKINRFLIFFTYSQLSRGKMIIIAFLSLRLIWFQRHSKK